MSRALVHWICLGACGCALTSRGAALSVRYFDPLPSPPRAGSASAQAPASKPVLRLGQVRGGSYLRERIAYRTSEHEVGYYDDREWTERPEVYVRRALERKLFEERGFGRATDGAAPSLEVEVLEFDELRLPRRHGVRVELDYQLRSQDAVLDERTITVDREVPGQRFEDVVRAMSSALDDATDQIADRVARAGAP